MRFEDLKIGMEIKPLTNDLLAYRGKLKIDKLVEEDDSFRIRDEDGYGYWFWARSYGKSWMLAENAISRNESEVKHLKSSDYAALIDIALMTRDEEWFNELHALVYGNGVGEQHA